jgi:hypothetical protein
LLTWAIHDAYSRNLVYKTPAGTSVYDNLVSIGQGVIEALGNAKPPTYKAVDPSDRWTVYGTPATTGYGINSTGEPNGTPTSNGQGQSASWIPYLTTNPNYSVTQWGFVRCYALQAWNEFNWNGGYLGTASASAYPVQYKEFSSSFVAAQGFIDYINVTINSMYQGQTFLKGTYSNINDLSSADITGVSLATRIFGQDCITAGKVIDLTKLLKFGLPSVLLQTIKKNNTLTPALTLALLASGLSNEEIDSISSYTGTATKKQEQQIYGAFLIVVGTDLQDILTPLNCKTQGINTLADLLNIKKLFPNSYKSLTVPIYNANPGPTNSKTYYPIFEGNNTSPRLTTPAVVAQVGTIIPPGPPPVVEPPAPPLVIEQPYVVPAVSPVGAGGVGSPEVVASTSPAPVAIPVTRGGGGGCVVLESYIPIAEEALYNGNIIKQAYQLCNGHQINLADETTLVSRIGSVKTAINEYQPCIRISTKDGISLVCSTTAPIPTKNNGIIKAPDTLQEEVAVLHNGNTYWSEVVKIEDVGMKFVRAIDTGNNSFWAGEIEGSYILHHNVFIRESNNEISKN